MEEQRRKGIVEVDVTHKTDKKKGEEGGKVGGFRVK